MRNSMLALTAAALIGLSGTAMAQGTGGGGGGSGSGMGQGPVAGERVPGTGRGGVPTTTGADGANPTSPMTGVPGAAQSGNPGIDRPRAPEATSMGGAGANPPVTGQSQGTPIPGPAQNGSPRP